MHLRKDRQPTKYRDIEVKNLANPRCREEERKEEGKEGSRREEKAGDDEKTTHSKSILARPHFGATSNSASIVDLVSEDPVLPRVLPPVENLCSERGDPGEVNETTVGAGEAGRFIFSIEV
jgi:hypothetical protein